MNGINGIEHASKWQTIYQTYERMFRCMCICKYDYGNRNERQTDLREIFFFTLFALVQLAVYTIFFITFSLNHFIMCVFPFTLQYILHAYRSIKPNVGMLVLSIICSFSLGLFFHFRIHFVLKSKLFKLLMLFFFICLCFIFVLFSV